MDQGNSYYNYMKQIPNWKFKLYWKIFHQLNTERYSEPCQTSKLELFANIVKSFQSLTNFVKLSILGAWRGSEYASVFTSAEAQNAKFRSFCN